MTSVPPATRWMDADPSGADDAVAGDGTVREGHAGEGTRRVLFLKLGSFSGTNARLVDALQRECPDLEVEALDVRVELRRRKAALAGLVGASLLEHGLPGRIGWSGAGGPALRSRLRRDFYRSKGVFDAVRRLSRSRGERTRYAFTLQTQSLFDGSLAGIPHFVYTDHAALAPPPGQDGPPPSEAWLAREREIYDNATHVFTFGPHVRDVIVNRYDIPDHKVSAVASGVQATVAAAADTRPERYRGRRILFVGRAWERKGGPDLLAAFRIVRGAVPDAQLVIVGTAAPAEEAGVTVTGILPPGEVAAQFRKASLFCLPSRLEPFGIVVAEAMHHGLPVVAARVGDIPSMVDDGVNGILVPPRSPEALAGALVRMLTDPDASARFAREGLRRAERYTWDGVAGRMARHFPRAAG